MSSTSSYTAVVIPAYNEETGIISVLDNLAMLNTALKIIPVLNGCTDNTRQNILTHSFVTSSPIHLAMMEYPLPLGIDVPRRWGAHCAYAMDADAVLFVDGDMTGCYADCLHQLVEAVLHHKCDLALVNCYPYIGYRSEIAKVVLYYREKLNRTLRLFSTIGLATPSHGPHCVSQRLIETIGTECFVTPPLMLAKAAKAHLQIQVVSTLNNNQWQSAQRGDIHNEKIAETIIGDCIAALEYLEGKPITRSDGKKVYLGYKSL
jgi:glycosyltransferase involved in cell wall biosynthesis